MIPLEMILLDQWVCAWNNSKIPMQATKRKAASSSDPSTWSTYQEAYDAVRKGIYDYVGFVFNGNGIIGIDIDTGYEDGKLSPIASDIISTCESWTEESRSGRGMHIYVKGDIPFTGRNNGNGVEIYKAKRYFIVTDRVFRQYELRENQEALDYVVTKYFPEPEQTVNIQKQKDNRLYAPYFDKPGEDGKIKLNPHYPPILPGNRNNSLTSLAGQLHNQGYSRTDIYKTVSRINKIRCNPPLPDFEVVGIINSVCKYKR